jgi:hypothetical protein
MAPMRTNSGHEVTAGYWTANFITHSNSINHTGGYRR